MLFFSCWGEGSNPVGAIHSAPHGWLRWSFLPGRADRGMEARLVRNANPPPSQPPTYPSPLTPFLNLHEVVEVVVGGGGGGRKYWGGI